GIDIGDRIAGDILAALGAESFQEVDEIIGGLVWRPGEDLAVDVHFVTRLRPNRALAAEKVLFDFGRTRVFLHRNWRKHEPIANKAFGVWAGGLRRLNQDRGKHPREYGSVHASPCARATHRTSRVRRQRRGRHEYPSSPGRSRITALRRLESLRFGGRVALANETSPRD